MIDLLFINDIVLSYILILSFIEVLVFNTKNIEYELILVFSD